MNKIQGAVFSMLMFLCCTLGQAQQDALTNTTAVVPTLINYGGTLTGLNGKPITTITGVTFLLYQDEQGGAPLWLESQNVSPDKSGHYTVQLGSTTAQGLPTDLFSSGEARWLAVQPQGQAEQPRVLLLSVPYAMKAADAQTLGGLPASAFMLAAPAIASTSATSASEPAAATSTSAPPPASSDVTTTGGTANAIPMFTTSTNIQNSIVTQTGTTAVNVAGKFNLPASGTATSTAGKNSQAQTLAASAYDSSTSAAVAQTFQLQAEPSDNDTSSPAGTLNLLFGSGTTAPSETGLKISNKGLITFATGQTFPGTGTITGITTASGSGLSGGGTTGTLSLKIPSAGVTNAMLADSSLTIAAGSGLTGGGKTSLGGTSTLSIASAGVTNAMLANSSITLNANSTGGLTTPGAMTLGSTNTIGLKPCSTNQVLQYSGSVWNCSSAGTGTITGVTAGTGLSGGGTSGTVTLSVSGVPLLAANNPFTGNNTFAGSVGVGTVTPTHKFEVDSSGASTAQLAMISTGTDAAISVNNTASGGREYWIDSGSGSAGVGIGNFGLWDATAGAARLAVNPSGSVGIGTISPYTQLHLVLSNAGALGPSLTLMNSAGGTGAGGSVDFDGYDPTVSNSPTARVQSLDDGNYSSNLTFQTKSPGAITNPLVEQVRISDYGSLIVDSSHNNAGGLSSSSAAGTGLIFGGAGAGEGITSCRSSSCPLDAVGISTQYGLEFYTNGTRRITIENAGEVDIENDEWVEGCTVWGNSNSQGNCVSDARLKTNVQPFPRLLNKLVQLQPVHFDWSPSVPPELHRRGTNQTGFVAQQVEKIFPEMVTMGKDGYRRVNYGLLPYLLLEGVREMKETNDNLQAEVRRQRQQNEKASAEIAKLRKSVAATQAQVARLDNISAAKDAQIAVMSQQIKQLRQAQEQMAAVLTRIATPGAEKEKHLAEAVPAFNSQGARTR